MQSDLYTKAGTLRKNKPGAGRPRKGTAPARRGYVRFGLTAEDVERRVQRQGGCAVCKVPAPRGKNAWHVDHDHGSGAVRGVLCITCNIAIGMMHDEPARLRAAAIYLERHAELQLL